MTTTQEKTRTYSLPATLVPVPRHKKRLKGAMIASGLMLPLVLLNPGNASAFSLGSIGNILGSFNGVLGQIGQVFNVPGISQVTNVLSQGQQWIDRIDNFEIGDLPSVLGDLGLDIPGLGKGELKDILGDMGLADPDASIDDILKNIDKIGKGEAGGAGNGADNTGGGLAPVTPGVNPAVVAPVYANNALAESVTRSSISEEGQKATQKMLKGAGLAADGSGKIATSLGEAATQLQAAAESGAEATGSQTSTQDVLKTGLTNLMALESGNASMLSGLAKQNEAIAQLNMAQISIGQQTRDGVHASVESLNLINQQMSQELQREISRKNAEVENSNRSIKSGIRFAR